MKAATILLIAGLLPYLLFAQGAKMAGQFTLGGKIIGLRHGYVYLSYIHQNGQRAIDSCAIQQKKFLFTGLIYEPTLATLRVGIRFCADDDPNAAGLYLEPNNMHVTIRHNHAKKMKVSGSQTQLEKDSLDRYLHISTALGTIWPAKPMMQPPALYVHTRNRSLAPFN